MRRAATVLVALLATAPVLLGGCVDEGPGSDFDQDGLLDRNEDVNDNVQYDFGETDLIRADTDADNLCDGQPPEVLAACRACEDCNNNGFWEPCLGETDPLNDDTDDDGTPDGEDPEPLEGIGVDCSQGNVQLAPGASLPPGKDFPPTAPQQAQGEATPTPTPTPGP